MLSFLVCKGNPFRKCCWLSSLLFAVILGCQQLYLQTFLKHFNHTQRRKTCLLSYHIFNNMATSTNITNILVFRLQANVRREGRVYKGYVGLKNILWSLWVDRNCFAEKFFTQFPWSILSLFPCCYSFVQFEVALFVGVENMAGRNVVKCRYVFDYMICFPPNTYVYYF